MSLESEQLLTELEAATERVIQLIVDNNALELEQGVVRQVQIMKKLSTFPQASVDLTRLQGIKKKVEQQQAMVSQALEVTGLFLQTLNELRSFNRLG